MHEILPLSAAISYQNHKIEQPGSRIALYQTNDRNYGA